MTWPSVYFASDNGEFMISKENMYERALRYLKIGVVVIPVAYKEKKPSIPWKIYQTQKPTIEEYKKWFYGKNTNMGIVTGEYYGLICVDQDSQEAIDYVNTNLPKTSMMTKTGSGKLHSYYRHPGTPIPNGVNINNIKIDIRGDGGQVVAPGSVHPKGGVYEEIGEWGPISELPIFDRRWFDENSPSDRTRNIGNSSSDEIDPEVLEYINSSEDSIEGSNGSAVLTKVARKFISGFKLNRDEAMRCLILWNVKCAKPLWSEHELEHALDNVIHTTGSNNKNKNNKKTSIIIDSILNWKYYNDGSPKSIKKTGDNLMKIIANHEDLHGVIGFNELISSAVILKEPPWHDCYLDSPDFVNGVAWSDDDTIGIIGWIESKYDVTYAPNIVNMAIDLVSKANSFHPIRKMLRSVEWDRIDRVNKMMNIYYGCEDTKYAQLVGRYLMISMVVRVEEPGCKVDHCVILEGLQSTCKSQSIRALARKSEYFIDSDIPIGKTDAYQIIRGGWLIEVPEIDKLFKHDPSDLKAYITSQIDTYRPSYGRRALKFPRQCVFIGTTNAQHYLKDITGNRRFWPIKTNCIDLEGLKRDADQLLAEALYLLQQGERWWPDREEQCQIFSPEQKTRMMTDVWEKIIWDYIYSGNKLKVEISEILEKAIQLKASEWNHSHENRVAKILLGFGWERKQLRHKGDGLHRRFYAYIKPLNLNDDNQLNVLHLSEDYDIE